jgi:hypothetical protein
MKRNASGYTLALPRLLQLLTDPGADLLLHRIVEGAVLDEQQHHAGSDLLSTEWRHPNRYLDQLVEVVGDEKIVLEACEIAAGPRA